jgi:hypothetical protein
MCVLSTFLHWFGYVLTVFTSGLYLMEYFKRKNHDGLMIGFLHAIKPAIENAAKTNPALQGYVPQIHDMLNRLQPPKK